MKTERIYSDKGAGLQGPGAFAGIRFDWRLQGAEDPDQPAGAFADLCEFPADWETEACRLLFDLAFVKQGIPLARRRVPQEGVPAFLWPSEPDEAALAQLPPAARCSAETSAKEVFLRFAGCLTARGWQRGLFPGEAAARAFHDELCQMLARRIGIAAPDLLARIGLDWAYGLPAAGADAVTEALICPVASKEAAAVIAAGLREDAAGLTPEPGEAILRGALQAVFAAITGGGDQPERNPALIRALRDGQEAGIPEGLLQRALDYARERHEILPLTLAGSGADTEAERGHAALGLDLSFIARLRAGDPEALGRWQEIGFALWSCGRPELVFDNEARGEGPEALLNLSAFVQDGVFDHQAFAHAARIWTFALDLALPATGAPAGRPLRLGFGDLAALLMTPGYGYDSTAGRSLAALLSLNLTANAWAASADLAAHCGKTDADCRAIAADLQRLSAALPGIAAEASPLQRATEASLAQALEKGRVQGWRNRSVTALSADLSAAALAGLHAAGCDPMPGLRETRLNGRGDFLQALRAPVLRALGESGYSPADLAELSLRALGRRSLKNAEGVSHKALISLGFGPDELAAADAALKSVSHLRYAFTQWVLGQEFCRFDLGIDPALLENPAFDLLAHLGFSEAEIAAANDHACGISDQALLEALPEAERRMLAIAPDLPPAALLAMRAAVQSGLSGAISGELILPRQTRISALLDLAELALESGLKRLKLRREGAQLSAVGEWEALEDLPLPPSGETQSQGGAQTGLPTVPAALSRRPARVAPPLCPVEFLKALSASPDLRENLSRDLAALASAPGLRPLKGRGRVPTSD